MNENSSLRVVDTDVAVTASGRSDASPSCVRACVDAIRHLMTFGCLVLDDGWRIIKEYQANLSSTGQPGVGDRFLLWVLRNQANPNRCEQVPITPLKSDPDSFEEFPNHPELTRFDPSDRKFVAVSAAHADRPPILQAVDSKWWGWRNALDECRIRVVFLCPEEIAAKYVKKIGQE